MCDVWLSVHTDPLTDRAGARDSENQTGCQLLSSAVFTTSKPYAPLPHAGIRAQKRERLPALATAVGVKGRKKRHQEKVKHDKKLHLDRGLLTPQTLFDLRAPVRPASPAALALNEL
uniref:Uncharacterized protein n=1 Tax=Knipowitschia caucasica TaxID=637954 RepID=A0AAV2KEK8_KNICA